MEDGVVGGLLEVAPAHVGEEVRHGREAAVVHLPTMEEGVAMEVDGSLECATRVAVHVSNSILAIAIHIYSRN